MSNPADRLRQFHQVPVRAVLDLAQDGSVNTALGAMSDPIAIPVRVEYQQQAPAWHDQQAAGSEASVAPSPPSGGEARVDAGTGSMGLVPIAAPRRRRSQAP